MEGQESVKISQGKKDGRKEKEERQADGRII